MFSVFHFSCVIKASSTGGRGNALSTLNLNSASSRTRTLNVPRNPQYDAYHAANNMHRSGAGRSSNNSCGTSSKVVHRNCADNEFDTISQASGEGVHAYNPDMVIFKAQDPDAAQHSTSSGDSSTSMLVAEHGFVRFRPMDPKEEKRAKRAAAAAAAAAAAEAQQNMPSSASSNSDNNNLNKNSPAIIRHHKRSLT